MYVSWSVCEKFQKDLVTLEELRNRILLASLGLLKIGWGLFMLRLKTLITRLNINWLFYIWSRFPVIIAVT